jgi:cation diffusion facilitator family transporter
MTTQHTTSILDPNLITRLSKKVSVISALTVVFIFIIKFLTSLFTNSLSFFAELTDSILDFVAITITIVGLQIAQKPADTEHMFGHAKVNSLAGVLQSLLIMALYSFIFIRGLTQLFHLSSYQVQNPGLSAVALIITLSIVTGVSRYILKIGEMTNNPLIKAQGLNFRGDYYRNIAIIIGLIMVTFGLKILDILLPMFFSVKAFWEAIKIIKQSVGELLDYNAVDPDEIALVRKKIAAIDPTIQIDDLSVRTAGNFLYSNLSISTTGDKSAISVSDLKDQIRDTIQRHFSNYSCNSMIQITTESAPPENFDQVMERIRRAQQNLPEIKNIHNISVDVMQDKILIQFHFDIAADMPLEQAHHCASVLEKEIVEEFPESYRSKLDIISHMEPERVPGKIHHHPARKLRWDLEYLIDEEIKSIPEIKDWSHPNVLDEGETVSVSLTIYLDGNLNIEHVHKISLRLEEQLKSRMNRLKRCIIHTEPFDSQKSFQPIKASK